MINSLNLDSPRILLTTRFFQFIAGPHNSPYLVNCCLFYPTPVVWQKSTWARHSGQVLRAKRTQAVMSGLFLQASR